MEDSWILNRLFNSDDRYLSENELVLISNLLLAKNANDYLGCLQFGGLTHDLPKVLGKFIPGVLNTLCHFKKVGITLDYLVNPTSEVENQISGFKDFEADLFESLMYFDSMIDQTGDSDLKMKQTVCRELYASNEDLYQPDQQFVEFLKKLEFHFKVEDIHLVQSIQEDVRKKFDKYLGSFKSRILTFMGNAVIYSDIQHKRLFEGVLKEASELQGNQNIKLVLDKPEYLIDGVLLKKEGFRWIEYAWLLTRKKKITLLLFKKNSVFISIVNTSDIEQDIQLQNNIDSYERINVFNKDFSLLRIYRNYGEQVEEIIITPLASLALKFVHQKSHGGQVSVSQDEIYKKVKSPYRNIFKNSSGTRYKTSKFIKSRKEKCELVGPYAIQKDGVLEGVFKL